MTYQELIRLEWYNLKDVEELSLSQLEDYGELLHKQLEELAREMKEFRP